MAVGQERFRARTLPCNFFSRHSECVRLRVFPGASGHPRPVAGPRGAGMYRLPCCDWFSRRVYTASPVAIGSHAAYMPPPLLRLVLTPGIYRLPCSGELDTG
eukprot:6015288-Pyramimonas_sp.AAC.2